MTRLSFVQIVRILAWAGDLLLIAAALTLLISRGGSLTTGMALVLILGIFLGGTLPILVYYLDFLFARNAARAAQDLAPESLRRAMEELDRLVQRVEIAASDASKTTIAARQVPGHIEAHTKTLDGTVERMETLLAQLNEALPDAPADASVPDSGPLQGKLTEIQEILDTHRNEYLNARQGLDAKLAAIEAHIQAVAPVSAAAPSGDAPPVSAAREPPQPVQEATPSAPSPKPEKASETIDSPKKRARPQKKRAKKRAAQPAESAPKPSADEELFTDPEASAELPANQSALIIKALVGVNNRIFVRGDPPLSWDLGRPLEATGIGEWRLDLEDLEAPIKAEIRLNDEIAAKGNAVEMSPGRITRGSPVFPSANEPF